MADEPLELELLDNEHDEAVRIATLIAERTGDTSARAALAAGRIHDDGTVTATLTSDQVASVMTLARMEVLSDPSHSSALWTLAAELDVQLGGDGDMSSARDL